VATGGSKATGGAATGGSSAGGSAVNCSASMPSGGSQTCSFNQTYNVAPPGLSWSIWSNGSSTVGDTSCITTYGSNAAFGASWSSGTGQNQDFLARMGLEWGNSGPTYNQYTITAQFAESSKSGNVNGKYSYIGIYGWSINPCIEWYIIDDSYGTMPVNLGSSATSEGTANIDGGTYNLYLRSTTGTGGNRCGSTVTSWNQFYSIRQTARTCGTISITQHFTAWANAKPTAMTLGTLLEAKILIETGGGTGSINFPIANVTAQ
jgi:endo-1,4-beta-xylanase